MMKGKQSKDGRFRVQYRFWLDATRPDDLSLAEKLQRLIDTRKFTQAARDGLRLVCDLWDAEQSLKDGNSPSREQAHLLEAMFPRLVRWIVDHHHAEELERVRQELAELRARVEVSSVPTVQRAPTPLPEVDVVVEKVKFEKGEIGKNFLKGLKGMASK